MTPREFAIHAHGDQKYGDKPYVFHLDQVHALAVEYGLSEDHQKAAYLHDVLEDCDIDPQTLSVLFGQNVQYLVWGVTGYGVGRKMKQHDIRRKMGDRGVALLKLCDRIANIEHAIKSGNTRIMNMYAKEHEEFSKLYFKDPLWDRYTNLFK